MLFCLEVAMDLLALWPRAERAHLPLQAMRWWPWQGSPDSQWVRVSWDSPWLPGSREGA